MPADVKQLTLLPAAPGTCPECAAGHDPDQPHDQQSLFYQQRFRARHGRWPTWKDALAHCLPDVRQGWEFELKRLAAWSEPPGGPPLLPWPKDAVMVVAALAGKARLEQMEDVIPVNCRHCGAALHADAHTIRLAERLPQRRGRPVKFFCIACHNLHQQNPGRVNVDDRGHQR